MSLQTPEELKRSVENLTRIIERLVAEQERLKEKVKEQEVKHTGHYHSGTSRPNN